MSEGRLAPVRETDRHAGLIAGITAACISAATFGLLHAVDVVSRFSSQGDEHALESFWMLCIVTALLGFVVGFAEGAIASRVAHRAAIKFQPLPALAKRIFIATAAVNVVIVAIAASVAFDGSSRAVALLTSIVVAVAASAGGAALFAWSHSLDWPHVPDYLRSVPSSSHRPAAAAAAAVVANDDDMIVDLTTVRNDVVKEKRRRHDPNGDDQLWQEVQDLISKR